MAIGVGVLAGCDARALHRLPPASSERTSMAGLVWWHADATLGTQVLERDVVPRTRDIRRGPPVRLLAHGGPAELMRRAANAAAGGVGPDLLHLPGEVLPDAAALGIVRAIEGEAARRLVGAGWTPNLVDTARWRGVPYGVPAAPHLRQPFFNDDVLRNAGLIANGRTTPPTTWAEFADVSKRVAKPEDRWGAVLPAYHADDELYALTLVLAHTAGGDQPLRAGDRVAVDTPPVREALQFLLDLIQKNGALPVDRPPYRLPETGRAGLWWETTRWLADQAAVGATLRAGATLVPRNRRGGTLVRGRHWCLGANASERDAALELLEALTDDRVSHAYCAGLSLPPARQANQSAAAYTEPKTASARAIWPVILAQLNAQDNAPLAAYPGYRTVAARIGGELSLVLTGKKSIPVAMTEGEAGVAELLGREPA